MNEIIIGRKLDRSKRL